jgi:hypothetical protein
VGKVFMVKYGCIIRWLRLERFMLVQHTEEYWTLNVLLVLIKK